METKTIILLGLFVISIASFWGAITKGQKQNTNTKSVFSLIIIGLTTFWGSIIGAIIG